MPSARLFIVALFASSASLIDASIVAAQTFGAPTPSTTAKPSAPVAIATTQFGTIDPAKGVQLGKELTTQYQIGMIVTAKGSACQGLYATAPVPVDWPEQRVQIIKEELTPTVQQISYRIVGGTVKQMLASIPLLPVGEEARALITVEVQRYSLLPPKDPSIFVLANPTKLPREVRPYLAPSKMIESGDYKIKLLAKEIMNGVADASAWEKVEAIYDVTREKVQYVNGPIKGARRALQDGTGDCEELTSLFIALCRANNIPARTVWVPDHCYPEFYLEDGDGNGYWFPCQAAGTREFGGITEHRPVLQKGDNFMVPEKKGETMRYVSEYITGTANVGGKPSVRFIRQILGSTNAPN